MLKSFSATLLLFAFACPALALTRFETVKAVFDSAAPLAPSDLDAAYSGRCFYAPNKEIDVGPDAAVGALLVGHASTQSADNAGPIFGAVPKQLKANLFNSYGDDLFYRFDSWTKEHAMDAFKGPGAVSTEVTMKGTDVIWHSKYKSGIEADFIARRSGKYIVVVSTGTTASNPGASVTCACYFYNQLK